MVQSANVVSNSAQSGIAPKLNDNSHEHKAHLPSEIPSADLGDGMLGDGMLLARNPGGTRLPADTNRAIQYRQKNPGAPAYQLPGITNIVPFRGSVTSLSPQAQSNVRAWNNKLPGAALQTDGIAIRVRLPSGQAPVVGFHPNVNPGVHAEETLVQGRQNEIVRFPNNVALPGTTYTNADLVRLMQARGEVENGRPTQKNTVALDLEKQKYEKAFAQSQNSQSNPVQGPVAPIAPNRDPRVPDLTLGTRENYKIPNAQLAQYGNPVPKTQPITNPQIVKYNKDSQLVSDLVQLGSEANLKPRIGRGPQRLDSGGVVEVRPGDRKYVDVKLSYPEGSVSYNFPTKPDGSPDIGNLPKNVEKIINDQAKKDTNNPNNPVLNTNNADRELADRELTARLLNSLKNPYGNTGSDVNTSTPAKKPATQIKPLENREINGSLPRNVLQDLQYYAARPNLRETAKAGQPAPSGVQTTYKDLGSAIKLTMPNQGKIYTYQMGVNPNGSVNKKDLPEALKSPPLLSDVLGSQAGKLPSTTEIERFKNPFRKQEPLTKLLEGINRIKDPQKAIQAIEKVPGETKKNQVPVDFDCEATIKRVDGAAENGKDYGGFVRVVVTPYINFPDGSRKIDNTALAAGTMRTDKKTGPLGEYNFPLNFGTVKGPESYNDPDLGDEMGYVRGMELYRDSRGPFNLLGNSNRYAAEGHNVDQNGFPLLFVKPNTTKVTELNEKFISARSYLIS
jgi:hypothetical protein